MFKSTRDCSVKHQGNMTLAEKASLLGSQGAAIPRLNISQYVADTEVTAIVTAIDNAMC